jgi:Recombination endonuclease VII
MPFDNAARRRRYAQSPELRKKAQARRRAYYYANKDEINAELRRKRREGDGSENAARRKRYAANPDMRRKARASARRYRRAHKAEIAEQRRLHRKQHPEAERKQRLRSTYGLSWDEYQAMLARQGGFCAMCKTKSNRPLCVDHCHKTGMVRGILCHPCNLTIGFCRDSTKLTRAATAYLEAAEKRHRRQARANKKKARPSPRAMRAGAVRWPATTPAAPRRRSGRKPCRPSAGRARGSRSRRGASRRRGLRCGCTRSRRSRPGGGGSRGPGCGRG